LIKNLKYKVNLKYIENMITNEFLRFEMKFKEPAIFEIRALRLRMILQWL